jgi:protocatechuate 3,4-dioxygenase beta subunit
MVILQVLLAAFTFAAFPMDQSPLQTSVMVRGTVVDARSGHRLAGAVVYASSGAFVQRAESNDRGNFYFLTLWPGTYTLSASKTGWRDCPLRFDGPTELNAGFEYLATVGLC